MSVDSICLTLRVLGVPAHLKGSRYILEAVSYCLSSNKKDIRITKEVYPYVAKKCKTKSGLIERTMRHAIEWAWKIGDRQMHQSLFGRSYPAKAPTNKEFVLSLAEHIAHDSGTTALTEPDGLIKPTFTL